MARYILMAALVLSPTWKYEKMDQETIKSQDKEKESEKALTTMTKQMKDTENLTVQLQPQFQKNNTTQKQKDRLFFKPAFTALNLDTVFFLLLIHTCGADWVQSISTLSQHMWSIGVLAELAFSVILTVYGAYKWKQGKKQDSDEIKAKPQYLEKMDEELNNELYKLNMFLCLRRLLENHRELFKLQLEDVEREREDNKEKIQSVEKLITESEREKATETTEELLREKKKLLSAQWKLERKKEDLEKLQLNTEKVLQSEEADGLLTRMIERKQNLEKGAHSLATKEELDNEVYKIIMFLCQRRLLENHRHTHNTQTHNCSWKDGEREDNKEKIQSVEKLITRSEREKATEATEELLREKQKLLSAQWKLERKKEDLEKLQLNTEKVLQSEEADGLLTRMTERKQNLEKKDEGT
ncbi:uncharacterized protein AB9X84_015511 isoform 2-T2 [Acanthopagrus schlegelii]